MKIQLAIVMMSVLAIAGAGLVGAQSKSDPAAAKILALETKWNDAYKIGDVSTMESLLSDDMIITVEDGSTFSKTGYLAHTADSALKVQMSDLSDLKVRTHGTVAVVTGAYHEKGTSKGKPYESRDRFTDVWMKTASGWQVIASHYSIPAS